MAVSYHVDRSNALEVGDILELEEDPLINTEDKVVTDEEEAAAIEETYPEGLSRHGNRYAYLEIGSNSSVQFEGDTEPFIGVYELENPETGTREHRTRDPTSAIYEWVFELVRKSKFSERPSRFQSFFGFETRGAAASFRSGTGAQVIEVEYDEGFTADMDLISCQSYAHGLHQASQYWQGKPGSDDPTLEILMQPPVEVIKVVDNPQTK
jgi:hypothetical protein